jgi:malate dehydrogenase (oxaloacetate-decarboxylating)(NADP+)
LLPPAKFTQNMQVKRVMRNVRGLVSPVEQHFHLLGLQERNERLFYRAMIEHPEELLPIMYTPTVGALYASWMQLDPP